MKKIVLLILALSGISFAYADTPSIRKPVSSDVASPIACAAYATDMENALKTTTDYSDIFNSIWYGRITNTELPPISGSITINGKTTVFYEATLKGNSTLSAGTLLCSIAGISDAINSLLLQSLNQAYQDAATHQSILDDKSIQSVFGFYGSPAVCDYTLKGCTLFSGTVNIN